MLDFITAPSCMELNTYLCAALAVAIVGNIYWFFKWAAIKGKMLNLYGLWGIELE